MTSSKTKKITMIGMLCAVAYVVMAFGRIPVVLFLSYDPKDVIIAIGGFLFGPLSAFAISAIVSVIEMLTVSDTGIIGCVMNILSTCSFACTAAFIYKKHHTLKGAVIGLLCGLVAMATVMVLWNYFLTPLYMGYPREAVAELLLPAFLPFNLLKGGLNTAITLLLYKPTVTALRKAHLVEVSDNPAHSQTKAGILLLAFLLLVTCIFFILVMRGVV